MSSKASRIYDPPPCFYTSQYKHTKFEFRPISNVILQIPKWRLNWWKPSWICDLIGNPPGFANSVIINRPPNHFVPNQYITVPDKGRIFTISKPLGHFNEATSPHSTAPTSLWFTSFQKKKKKKIDTPSFHSLIRQQSTKTRIPKAQYILHPYTALLRSDCYKGIPHCYGAAPIQQGTWNSGYTLRPPSGEP